MMQELYPSVAEYERIRSCLIDVYDLSGNPLAAIIHLKDDVIEVAMYMHAGRPVYEPSEEMPAVELVPLVFSGSGVYNVHVKEFRLGFQSLAVPVSHFHLSGFALTTKLIVLGRLEDPTPSQMLQLCLDTPGPPVSPKCRALVECSKPSCGPSSTCRHTARHCVRLSASKSPPRLHQMMSGFEFLSHSQASAKLCACS